MASELFIWRYTVRKNKRTSKPKNHDFQNPAELAGWIININLAQGDSITLEPAERTYVSPFFIGWLSSCLFPADFEVLYQKPEDGPKNLTIKKL